MKKFLQNVLVISISMGIFSCSKKVTTFNFGKPYHDQSVNNYKAQDVKILNEAIILDEQASASIETSVTEVKPVSIKIEETSAKSLEIINTPVVEKKKSAFKDRLITKMIKKKIEKLEKGPALEKNMKIGIIIAAISLAVLITVAIGGFGVLSTPFWILGVLGLLGGATIIVLSALDVI